MGALHPPPPHDRQRGNATGLIPVLGKRTAVAPFQLQRGACGRQPKEVGGVSLRGHAAQSPRAFHNGRPKGRCGWLCRVHFCDPAREAGASSSRENRATLQNQRDLRARVHVRCTTKVLFCELSETEKTKRLRTSHLAQPYFTFWLNVECILACFCSISSIELDGPVGGGFQATLEVQKIQAANRTQVQ